MLCEGWAAIDKVCTTTAFVQNREQNGAEECRVVHRGLQEAQHLQHKDEMVCLCVSMVKGSRGSQSGVVPGRCNAHCMSGNSAVFAVYNRPQHVTGKGRGVLCLLSEPGVHKYMCFTGLAVVCTTGVWVWVYCAVHREKTFSPSS